MRAFDKKNSFLNEHQMRTCCNDRRTERTKMKLALSAVSTFSDAPASNFIIFIIFLVVISEIFIKIYSNGLAAI